MVVPEVPGWITPRPKRSALTADASLRAVGSVLSKYLAAVVGIHHNGVVGVAHEGARAVDRFIGVAGAISKTGADDPACSLLQAPVARRRNDLGIHLYPCVGNISVVVARRRNPE
ncbi:hypothetical protein RRF57_007924 [Xylaria bambusicola]|uniref:Uncharacterized protein n=1 Tax=Xylaria bambusicola TaxID=326684 RepID=A0AAN7ZAQ2_9PEZI